MSTNPVACPRVNVFPKNANCKIEVITLPSDSIATAVDAFTSFSPL